MAVAGAPDDTADEGSRLLLDQAAGVDFNRAEVDELSLLAAGGHVGIVVGGPGGRLAKRVDRQPQHHPGSQRDVDPVADRQAARRRRRREPSPPEDRSVAGIEPDDVHVAVDDDEVAAQADRLEIRQGQPEACRPQQVSGRGALRLRVARHRLHRMHVPVARLGHDH